MLINTSKMKTAAAQMARSNRGTEYKKDMLRKPSAKREVLGASVVKTMVEASDRKK